MPRKQKVRPEGWGPDVALQLASEGRVKKGLQALSASLGVGWEALYSDIQEWKANVPSFMKAWEIAMDAHGTSRGGGRPKVMTPDVKESFLEHFDKTGSKVKSATACGVSWSHIYNMIRPGHRAFDADFAHQIEEIERNIIGEMEDTLIEGIRKAEQPRDQILGARAYLERRDPERWGKQVEMTVKGKVEHRHEHKHSLTDMKTLLQQEFSRFAPKELPEGSVDAEFEEVVDASN